MKKMFASVVLFLLIFSCSLPVVRSGKADLEFSLGGVLPAIADEDLVYAAGSRAITPNSLMVQAVITNEEFSRTYKAPVRAGTALIAGLPAFKKLTITLETLDLEGEAITSWKGTVTLEPGRNSVQAVMKPVSTVAEFPTGAGGVTIPFGKAQFYKATFPDNNGENLVYLDTITHEHLWMGVYNENWEPLDTIAESKGDGWAVVNLSTHPTIYVAIANMRNTGYPPSEKQVSIGVKKAIFVSASSNFSSQGTSTDPWNIERMITDINEYWNAAYFLAAGSYESSSGYFELNNSQWIFGGFDPADWKKRDPRTTIIYSNSAEPAVMLRGSSLKIIDGITVRTNWLGDAQTHSSYALQAEEAAYALIKNCRIDGPAGSTEFLTEAGALSINDNGVTIHLYQTELHGGTLTTGTTQTSLSGINIPGSLRLFIIACMVDGGNLTSTSSAEIQTQAVSVTSGSIYAASSYFWGGVSRSTANSSAYGFNYGFNYGSNVSVSIFSSVISGGYASSSNAVAKTVGFKESNYMGGVEIKIFACLIDGGIVVSSDGASYSAAVYADQSATGMQFYGSILVSSAAKDINGVRIPVVYNSSLPVVNNCVFAGFSNDAYNIASSQYTTITSAQDLRRFPGTMEDFFRSYISPDSFSAFIANTWRSQGVLAGLKSSALPETWQITEGGDLAGYFPSLIVDLENRLRPFTDYWTIGPYQN